MCKVANTKANVTNKKDCIELLCYICNIKSPFDET